MPSDQTVAKAAKAPILVTAVIAGLGLSRLAPGSRRGYKRAVADPTQSAADDPIWARRAAQVRRRLAWGWWWAAVLPWFVGLCLVGSGLLLGLRRVGYSGGLLGPALGLGALIISVIGSRRRRRVAAEDVWVRLDRGHGLEGRLLLAVEGKAAWPPPSLAPLAYPWRWRRFAVLGLSLAGLLLCTQVPRRALGPPPAPVAAEPLSWQLSRQLIREAGEGPPRGLRAETVRRWQRALRELEASTPVGQRFTPAAMEAGANLNARMGADLQRSRRAVSAAQRQLARAGRPGGGGAGAGGPRPGRTPPPPGAQAGGPPSGGAQAGRTPGGAQGAGAEGLQELPAALRAQLKAAQGGGASAQARQQLAEQLKTMSGTLRRWESGLRRGHPRAGGQGQGQGQGHGQGQGQGQGLGHGVGRGGGSRLLVLRDDPGAALPATPHALKPGEGAPELGDRVGQRRFKAQVSAGQADPRGGGRSPGSVGGQWIWPDQQLSVPERRMLRELLTTP